MIEFLAAPMVVAAVVTGVLSLLAPVVGRWIQQLEKKEIESVAVELRQMDADQLMLDRLQKEVARHQKRIEVLEGKERKLYTVLVQVEADLRTLRDQLEALNEADLALRAVKTLDMVRRGLGRDIA